MNRYIIQVVLFLIYTAVFVFGNTNTNRHLIQNVTDINEFNKIVKTVRNVLAVFSTNEELVALTWMPILSEAAHEMKGFATILFVPCDDAKAMCEELGVLPPPVMLKYYNKGKYNKDYDRSQTVKSVVRFLNDPAAAQPWDELEESADVVHLENEQELNNFLATEKKPVIVMFHAPWCPFCEQMKPHFAQAATELKGNTVLVGIEGDNEAAKSLEQLYNVEVYPTIFLFENGVKKFEYLEDLTKEALLEWIKAPYESAEQLMEQEPEGEAWSDQKSEVVHLTDATFDPYLAEHPSVMVMFYAPWCGHCKEMKPEYTDAAGVLAADGMPGVLAAIDGTKSEILSDRYEILAYPTVKYFKDGNYAWDFEERTKDKIVEHLKNPQEPPPPPSELGWEEEVTAVHHLNTENFQTFTEQKKHCLVMFYAPWCGHCQAAKPGFTAAAEELKGDPKVAFAAVDCDLDANDPICATYEATSYPTFTYLNYGKDPEKYMGKRTEEQFINFMSKRINPDWQENRMKDSTNSGSTHGHFWANLDGSKNVLQLGSDLNDFVAKQDIVVVMFYAQWCVHSKAMRSDFSEAATRAIEMKLNAVFAAVDAEAHSDLADQYQVKSYPTVTLFLDGQYVEEYDGDRSVEDLIDFANLQEYDEDPGTDNDDEAKWSDEPSAVNHLTDENFSSFIAANKNVLAMFYSPWCGHCQDTKPHFFAAADKLKDKPEIQLAAIDCTTYSDLCTKNDVGAYPTIKVFQNGVLGQLYNAKRDTDSFVNFMSNLKPVDSRNPDEL